MSRGWLFLVWPTLATLYTFLLWSWDFLAEEQSNAENIKTQRRVKGLEQPCDNYSMKSGRTQCEVGVTVSHGSLNVISSL